MGKIINLSDIKTNTPDILNFDNPKNIKDFISETARVAHNTIEIKEQLATRIADVFESKCKETTGFESCHIDFKELIHFISSQPLPSKGLYNTYEFTTSNGPEVMALFLKIHNDGDYKYKTEMSFLKVDTMTGKRFVIIDGEWQELAEDPDETEDLTKGEKSQQE